MRRAALALTATMLLTSTAWAGARCDQHPKGEWMPQSEAKAKIEAQGYKISKFKVDGHCYEIYGFDKDGNRAEVYFDTKTLAVVKAEIRKK
ncbi:MAG TPA: PepSY domain-containing protein [Methylomirabilota bacterium]